MEFRFHLAGAARKELVTAVSKIAGRAAVYQKAPTFAYVVGDCVIDKDGTLVFDEGTDIGHARSILAELAERGFTSDDALDPADPKAGDPAAELARDGAPVEEMLCGNKGADRLVIEIPLECFSETALLNLEKLVASKAALIRKAVGADDLTIEQAEDKLRFPWFALGSSSEEVHAYTQFVHALCEMSKKQKRVTAKEKPADSEKFAFRCFLLRLGFIGDEYAAARRILLANLPGNGSFKGTGPKRQPDASNDDVGAENATHDLAEMLADAELVYQVNHMEAGV